MWQNVFPIFFWRSDLMAVRRHLVKRFAIQTTPPKRFGADGANGADGKDEAEKEAAIMLGGGKLLNSGEEDETLAVNPAAAAAASSSPSCVFTTAFDEAFSRIANSVPIRGYRGNRKGYSQFNLMANFVLHTRPGRYAFHVVLSGEPDIQEASFEDERADVLND